MVLPKIDDRTESIFVSQDQYIYQRDYRSLLRSVGHMKPYSFSGQDPFHVYRETELPGYGALVNGEVPLSEGSVLTKPFEWRPSLCRGLSGNDFGYIYDQKLPDPSVDDFSDFVFELNDFGTKSIAKLRPGNPIASAGQFIGELHDLPQLPTSLHFRADIFRRLGENYLNVEFGWKPFINDLRKMYKYSVVIDRFLNNLRNGNGVNLRRRNAEGTVETSDVSEGFISGLVFGPVGSTSLTADPNLNGFYLHGPEWDGFGGSMTGTFKYKYQIITKVDKWYVGTFRYYVPDIGSLQWDHRAKSVLYGVGKTPQDVWELLPWSWLIDWFSNVGDIISNWTRNAVDGEVLTDSFSMQHFQELHKIACEVTWDDYVNHSTGLHVFPGESKFVYLRERENKLRQPSNPFAFGSSWHDWSSFTSRQLAILAALGITNNSVRRVTKPRSRR